jgi:hypothetical protein
MQIKITRGISLKEYREDITDLVNVAEKAYGDRKALAAMTSAIEGHKLALQFWQCDRLTGYEKLHQCQDKVLKGIFNKYPDLKAQALAAVEGEKLSYISAGLDKDAVLQALWQKTAQDTHRALQVVSPNPIPKKVPGHTR